MQLTIPETGFVRLTQVLEVIPIGKTCWWEGVKSGRFPKPVKLSRRCTAWKPGIEIYHLGQGVQKGVGFLRVSEIVAVQQRLMGLI